MTEIHHKNDWWTKNLWFLTEKIDLIHKIYWPLSVCIFCRTSCYLIMTHYRKIFYDRTDANIHLFYLACQRVYDFKKWSNPDTFMKLSNSQGSLNLSCFDFKFTITKQNLDPNILASQNSEAISVEMEFGIKISTRLKNWFKKLIFRTFKWHIRYHSFLYLVSQMVCLLPERNDKI